MAKKAVTTLVLAIMLISLPVFGVIEKAQAEVPTECVIAATFGWHAGWANLACMIALMNDILDVYDPPGDGDTIG